MLQVENNALACGQVLKSLVHHPCAQDIVHFDDRLALQVLPYDEVDLPVGWVGVEAETGLAFLRKGNRVDFDGLAECLLDATGIGGDAKGGFSDVMPEVPNDVDGVAVFDDEACLCWLQLP